MGAKFRHQNNSVSPLTFFLEVKLPCRYLLAVLRDDIYMGILAIDGKIKNSKIVGESNYSK